ncbi:MAG: 50S ribosomal protein L9 [bacterium]
MKIILLKDVRKVGKKYDIKEVAEGYASNMLIPHGEAIVANPENLKKITALMLKDAAFRKIDEDILNKNLTAIKETVLEIAGKTNDKGHLFAGIHKEQIAEELKKQAHIDLLAEFILLVKPLKEVGEHVVEVEAHGKKVNFKVVIKSLE